MAQNQDSTTMSHITNEAHLRAVLETVIDGIITINCKGIIQTINPATEGIFGYSAAELVGENIKILMPESYACEHDGYLHSFLTTGDKKVIGIGREVIGKRKDGSTFPMELAVSEMEVSGERMFAGIIRNISERKQAEAELLASEQRILTLLDTIVDAIIVIDAKGVIQSFNPAAETLFGINLSEALGQNVRILMPEPERGAHDGYLRNYFTSGVKKIIGLGREVTGKRKDGSTFPMELAVSEMEINGEHMFTGIVRDISERKLAEAALADKTRAIEISASYERTQAQVMSLFSSHFQAEAVFKLVLPLLAENHKFPVSAVYIFDEWHGVLNCVASFGLPEGTPRELTPGSGLIGQAAVARKTLQVVAPDAMPFKIDAGLFQIAPAAVVACPITYGEKVIGVLALASLTEPDEQELGFIDRLCDQIGISLNNLNQYHDLKALSEQLKQRGKEITKKNTELEKANRLKTEFLANMSHELRTPLNAIIGFSEVLKDGMMGELNEGQADYMGEIFDSANHLLSLINDILDLSKIEAGKMELYLEPLNLPELLRNALSVVKEKAHSNNIVLNINISDEIGMMQADGRKLKQIIFNLLSNAVKFTPNGGQVSIDVCRADDQLVISVTDTGIGIAKDKIGLLFSAFEQLDGALSRQYEGTGLGLVMVKRLVELHGGQIDVTSEAGVGSCFRFEIPFREMLERDASTKHSATEAKPKPTPLKLTPVPSLKSTERIVRPEVLIIEDTDSAAELMTVQLTGAGYQVHRARDGSEGLKLAAQYLPSLVVLDILLPDFDGWELMRRMKQDAALQETPVIVVSIVADAKRGLELGAVNVLEKPVQKRVLLEAIGRVVSPEKGTQPCVLVVDDEEKAVKFMAAQLVNEGYQAIEAYGGQQAIELARSEHPDLIILDLMMPEVTGFDVVATLRSCADTAAIPVIILTAKVLTAEDRLQLKDAVIQIVEKSEFDIAQFLLDVEQTVGQQNTFPFRQRVLPGDSPLVLVVEDNEDQAELLRLYLEDAGCRVALAENGREGLEQLQANPPSLITLDLLMPEMDGFAFLEAKAAMPEYAHIPVMVLSANADQLDGRPLSADAVMRKPVRRSELLHIIDGLLPPQAHENNQRAKLLLIDDDPKAIKIVSSYLPEVGYEIMTAFGGADGIELAQSERPDLIVLDLMMPDVSGFDVLKALKGNDSTHNIPVVILTAKLLSNEERAHLQDQVAVIAEKGKASREMLTSEIERILRRYHLL